MLYSYSFAQTPRWSRRYPGQEEILVSTSCGLWTRSLTTRQDYLTDVAQKYGLYKHARFHSAVEEAHWNDKSLKWEIAVAVGGGKESEFTSSYKITSDFLVTAAGQLNKPKGIDVPGYHDYQGKTMHSARWDWSYDIRGKRIAVIGNGKFELKPPSTVLTLYRCDHGSDCARGCKSGVSTYHLPKNASLGTSTARLGDSQMATNTVHLLSTCSPTSSSRGHGSSRIISFRRYTSRLGTC